MALPKKKTPKAKQRKRRSHLATTAIQLTACTRCHAPRRSHQVCPSCGFYRGREAIAISAPELPE